MLYGKPHWAELPSQLTQHRYHDQRIPQNQWKKRHQRSVEPRRRSIQSHWTDLLHWRSIALLHRHFPSWLIGILMVLSREKLVRMTRHLRYSRFRHELWSAWFVSPRLATTWCSLWSVVTSDRQAQQSIGHCCSLIFLFSLQSRLSRRQVLNC